MILPYPQPSNRFLLEYSDNKNNSNSVIDLFFLWSNSVGLNNYKIHPELQFLSDHTFLTIDIIIKEKFIPKKKHTIVKNSKEEFKFLEDFIRNFGSINIVNITSLKSIVQEYTDIAKST